MEFSTLVDVLDNLEGSAVQVARVIMDVCSDTDIKLPTLTTLDGVVCLGDNVQIAVIGKSTWLILAELNGRTFGVCTRNSSTKAKYLFKILLNLPHPPLSDD